MLDVASPVGSWVINKSEDEKSLKILNGSADQINRSSNHVLSRRINFHPNYKSEGIKSQTSSEATIDR